MVMRKEKNSIILEPGDRLCRYDLGTDLSVDWSTEYENPEYIGCEFGKKNAIGAFFFYDKKTTAKKTLAQAIYNQNKKGNIYNSGTITYCEVVNELNLLDLDSGLIECSNIISFLVSIDANVIENKFVTHHSNKPYSELQSVIVDIFSTDHIKRINAADEINKFFFYNAPYLGQSLTDYENGILFKSILEEKNYEGYVFFENPESNTYCIFNSDKISDPIHEEVYIDTDDELKEFLLIAEKNDK